MNIWSKNFKCETRPSGIYYWYFWLYAVPWTLGAVAVAVGGKQFFSLLLQNVWLVSCTLVFAEVLSLWSTAYPVHLCFAVFFCIIPSFTGRFSREALGKTWRESLTPSHSPVLLSAGMAPSTFLLVIIVAVCFYRPLVQRGAVASPLHSLVLLFPLVFMKDFCRLKTPLCWAEHCHMAENTSE